MRKLRGFTLVELLVVITIIGILVALLLPAIQAAREAARRMQCGNNLKQITLALHGYIDVTRGMLPRGAETYRGQSCCCNNADYHPGHTVHTMLLPYVEQQTLYDQYDMKIPWFAQKAGVIDQAIPGYLCPAAVRWQVQTVVVGSTPSWGGAAPSPLPQVYPHNYPAAGSDHGYGGCGRHGNTTLMGAFAQRWGILEEAGTPADPRLKIASITDGTSTTLAFGETAQDRPTFGDTGTADAGGALHRGRGWADPYYFSTWFTVNRVATPNSHLGGFQLRNTATATSFHPAGCNFSFLDGSVKFLSDNIDGATWSALGSVRGAETVTVP